MDADQARRNSPVFACPAWPMPVLLAVGGEESGEYLRQSASLAKAWRKAGGPVQELVLPGLNHFTVLDPLMDRRSPLAKALISLLR
jgi:arylformamidase